MPLISILIYSIGILIAIQLLHITYYKIRYPFWNKLSAFHTYQWWYWLLNEKTLNSIKLSREGKYYRNNYKTIKLNENMNISNIVNFINNHFMNFNDTTYKITEQQLSNIYSTDTYITTSIMEDGSINGIIISLPFLFWSRNFNIHENKNNKAFKYKTKNYSFSKIQYVDFLCVHKKHRKNNIATTLIYTHLLNVKNVVDSNTNFTPHLNHNLFLFKNEGFKTKALVPVLNYNGYIVDLENVDLNSCKENISVLKSQHCQCTYLDPKNSKQLNDFINCIYNIQTIKNCNIEFISIFPEEILINHIKSSEILIYILKCKNELIGFYIFKNIHSLINSKKYEFISCCSLQLSQNNENYKKTFIWGFKIACVLCKNHLNNLYCSNNKHSYDLCCIEDIAHNNNIIHKIGINNESRHIYKIPLYYYMYNGLIHTRDSKKAFILS